MLLECANCVNGSNAFYQFVPEARAFKTMPTPVTDITVVGVEKIGVVVSHRPEASLIKLVRYSGA